MNNYKYLIIGGGMTGHAAVKGIRENDSQGSILMISQEPYGPYDRPPLSKGLWENGDVDSIQRPLDEFQVDLKLETKVETIDPDNKKVQTSSGETFKYEKLLLATGGVPNQLPDAPKDVIYFRTRQDFESLHALTKDKDSFCVIGGGFIGSELAAALNKQNKNVTMIFPENGISDRIFPDDLAEFLVDYYQEKGVKVLTRSLIDSISKEKESLRISYRNVENDQTSEEQFDGVIAGIGIRPNVALAKDAGLTVEDGIVVNEFLQTNHPDIYAAGDVANFFNFALGKRTRVEHEDNANTMGKIAGLNMSGDLQKYDHFPMFYSDLFDLGYEAVGEFNQEFDIFEDWIEPFNKGTIYYLDNDQIKGLIFWNLWGKVDQGKELIQTGSTFKKTDLQGMFTE